MTLSATPRNLIGLSAILLLLALMVSVLNVAKMKSLRASAIDAVAARNTTEPRRATHEQELKIAREMIAAAGAQSDAENKAARAEAELVKVQADKTELKLKLQANEGQIAELQRRIEETTTKPSANPGAPSAIELQAQLDDARTQLDAAEREKALLADKIHIARERSSQLEEDKKRHDAVSGKAGVRGTVLAVNQAYNFVVLNLGGRHGLETNAEMLVVRGGALIGKIRVSSVEPSTAIADIITGSLARGVQVQPGDMVIYAGNS
jgi:polyisoprenoid-binding protein YceI